MKYCKSIKFGGTALSSLRSTIKWCKIVKISFDKFNLSIVLSAISKITDELSSIIFYIRNSNLIKVKNKINFTIFTYRKILKELFLNNNMVARIYFSDILFILIKLKLLAYNSLLIGNIDLALISIIYSFGEKLSSIVFSYSCNKFSIKNNILE